MIRNTSRRMTLALAAMGTTAMMLVGCSSPAEESNDDPATSASGSITFSNWQWLEPGRGETLWGAVSGYTTANPDAELEKSETAFAQYADKLNTELGAGGGPDVFVVLDSQFVTLVDAGILEPLNDVLEDADLNSSNEPLVVDGEQLGVTWEQPGYALLGNKNVMAAAGITELPTTVDELIAAGQAVEAIGADGFAVRHRMSEFDGWYLDFQSWPFGFGGAWSDGEELTIDAPENVEAVEAFKKVYDSGIMPIGDDASTFRTKFKENQLGFMIDNSGAASSFTAGGQITGQDIVSGPLPFPEPGAHQKLILAVNANSDNKDLATDFVKWFVTEDAQTAIRPSMGASTLATDVALDEEFAAANPWAETYLELGAENRGTLIPGFETDTKAIMQTIMQAVERVITQGQDPKAALGQAQKEEAE